MQIQLDESSGIFFKTNEVYEVEFVMSKAFGRRYGFRQLIMRRTKSRWKSATFFAFFGCFWSPVILTNSCSVVLLSFSYCFYIPNFCFW
jgi:hypothetical protein